MLRLGTCYDKQRGRHMCQLFACLLIACLHVRDSLLIGVVPGLFCQNSPFFVKIYPGVLMPNHVPNPQAAINALPRSQNAYFRGTSYSIESEGRGVPSTSAGSTMPGVSGIPPGDT